MLGFASTATLSCDRCEDETSRAERGWRAYAVGEPAARIVVLCPRCAERICGEDEVPDRI